MLRSYSLVLTCGIALIAGCAHNNSKKATTQMASNTAACESTETAAAPAPTVATDHLAGAWQLAIPRHNAQEATITATDATHVTIKAGDHLSGNYVVQGKYLLILTNDENLRPLAWRINSADSLTVVRAPELGENTSDFTGVTLLRAAGDAAASTSPESQANTSEQSPQ